MKFQFSLPKITAILLATATISLGRRPSPTPSPQHQQRLVKETGFASSKKVPGNNNAFYDLVPMRDQLLKIEYLDIDPMPMPLNKPCSIRLHGLIPHSSGITESQLASATLTFTIKMSHPGKPWETVGPYTIALRSFMDDNSQSHLYISDDRGQRVDHLTKGWIDIEMGGIIPGMFVKKGMYRFQVEARLGKPDGRYLFDLSLEQWLENTYDWDDGDYDDDN